MTCCDLLALLQSIVNLSREHFVESGGGRSRCYRSAAEAGHRGSLDVRFALCAAHKQQWLVDMDAEQSSPTVPCSPSVARMSSEGLAVRRQSGITTADGQGERDASSS